MVDAAEPGQPLRRDHLRRSGAFGKDAGDGTELLPVGDVLLFRRAFRAVWQDDRRRAAKSLAGTAAAAARGRDADP